MRLVQWQFLWLQSMMWLGIFPFMPRVLWTEIKKLYLVPVLFNLNEDFKACFLSQVMKLGTAYYIELVEILPFGSLSHWGVMDFVTLTWLTSCKILFSAHWTLLLSQINEFVYEGEGNFSVSCWSTILRTFLLTVWYTALLDVCVRTP